MRIVLLLQICLTCIGPVMAAAANTMLDWAKCDRDTFGAGASCTLLCQVRRPVDVQLQVTDAAGAVVRTIFAYQLAARASYRWDGKDERGRAVTAGIYTIVVKAGRRPRLDTSFGIQGQLNDFVSPYDAQVDPHGNLYVADCGGRALYAFTPEGKPLATFGQNGKLALAGDAVLPWVIRIDDAGNIYFNGPRYEVSKIDRAGRLLTTIGGLELDETKTTRLPGSTGLATGIGLANGKLYIFDASNPRSIYAFDPGREKREGFLYQAGEALNLYTAVIPGKARSYWGYVGPCGKAAPDGSLYASAMGGMLWKIVDTGKDLVKRYSVENGPDGLPMKSTCGMDIGPDGSIWVADWGNCRIVRFTDTGTALETTWQFGARDDLDLDRQLLVNPHSVVISPDGEYLYIVEDGEPMYDFARQESIPGTAGRHRVSRWIIDGVEDRAEVRVTFEGAQ